MLEEIYRWAVGVGQFLAGLLFVAMIPLVIISKPYGYLLVVMFLLWVFLLREKD